MQALLENAALNLLRAREQIPALTDEADMLGILLAAYDLEDHVAIGMSRVLDRWLALLLKIDTELDAIQDDLRLVKQAAGPVEHEPTREEEAAAIRASIERLQMLLAQIDSDAAPSAATVNAGEYDEIPEQTPDEIALEVEGFNQFLNQMSPAERAKFMDERLTIIQGGIVDLRLKLTRVLH